MFRYVSLILFFLLFSSVAEEKNVHSFVVKNIDGNAFNMATLKGKAVLLVNVASNCGLTPQYRQLQALHDKYSGKGFVIMAFPATKTLVKVYDTDDADIDVLITAYQWKWKYEYLDDNGENVSFFSVMTTPRSQIENREEKSENSRIRRRFA